VADHPVILVLARARSTVVPAAAVGTMTRAKPGTVARTMAAATPMAIQTATFSAKRAATVTSTANRNKWRGGKSGSSGQRAASQEVFGNR